MADTLGVGGVYRDPMWRITVELTDVERALLATWWVRRLGFVTHAGAAALAATQSYSRLEHSLGLLALTAHFDPDDRAARAAALLHDIGHLPLSHTFERVAGLDHHELGAVRVGELDDLLDEHGLSPEEILAIDDGRRPSVLSGRPGVLKLDHLESFVRSGRAHGRTREPPSETLRNLSVIDGGVSADPGTAAYLVELAVGEARWLCSPVNAVASGVVRHLAGLLLADRSPRRIDAVAAMTDDEFWAELLGDDRTRDATRALRRRPLWPVTTADDSAAGPGLVYEVPHLYLDMPLVDGRSTSARELRVADVPSFPWSIRILPPPGVRVPGL